GHHQALGPLGETDHDVLARLQVFQSAATQGFDVHEDVAGFAVADHETIALGAVEPLDLGALERTGRRGRAPGRTVAIAAAAATGLAVETVAVAAEAAVTIGGPVRTFGRRRGGLVQLDDLGNLPALRPLDDVAGNAGALRRTLVAGLAQAGHMPQDVLKARLAWIVRNDEAITLARVKPLHMAADTNRFLVGFGLLNFVTRHARPLARPNSSLDEHTRITLFSLCPSVNDCFAHDAISVAIFRRTTGVSA